MWKWESKSREKQAAFFGFNSFCPTCLQWVWECVTGLFQVFFVLFFCFAKCPTQEYLSLKAEVFLLNEIQSFLFLFVVEPFLCILGQLSFNKASFSEASYFPYKPKAKIKYRDKAKNLVQIFFFKCTCMSRVKKPCIRSIMEKYGLCLRDFWKKNGKRLGRMRKKWDGGYFLCWKKKRKKIILMIFISLYITPCWMRISAIFQKAHDHGESVNSLWTATAIARLKTAMEEVVKLFATRWQPPLEMPTPFGVGIEPGWFGSRVNKRYNVGYNYNDRKGLLAQLGIML